MNIKEWYKACEEGWAYRRYDNASRQIQKSLKYNSDPNATVRHHLRDTEEQRKYNDEHYELWGFEIDEDGAEHFEYGKYIIFCTAEEHCSVWHNISGENNPNYGKCLTDEHKRKISESKTGHSTSEETKERISESLKRSDKHPWRGRSLPDHVKHKLSYVKKNSYHPYRGSHLSEEHRNNISSGLKGHTTSDETRLKISDSLKGHTVSNETRKKISDSRSKVPGKPHTESVKKAISDKKRYVSEIYHRYKDLGGSLSWNSFNKYFSVVYSKDDDSFNLEFTV